MQPTPNRFIFKKPSGVPHGPAITDDHRELEVSAPPRQSLSQFAGIPRFSAPAGRTSSYPPHSPSPTKLNFVSSGTPQTLQRDDVHDEDTRSDDGDADMLDNYITPSFEGHNQPAVDGNLLIQPSSPKRVKLDLTETQATIPPSRFMPPPPIPLTNSTQFPASQSPGSARFLVPPSPSQFSTQPAFNSHPSAPSRPTFLRPPVLPPTPNAPITDAEPLPDAFSPHRKGQRFIPGGMAAELSSWVIGTGQAAVASRRGRGWMQGDEFVRVVRITRTSEGVESHSGGLGEVGQAAVFLEAVEVHEDGGGDGTDLRVVLVQKGSQSDNVSNGDVVGIRAPSWNVCIGHGDEQESWVVGVDWKLVRS